MGVGTCVPAGLGRQPASTHTPSGTGSSLLAEPVTRGHGLGLPALRRPQQPPVPPSTAHTAAGPASTLRQVVHTGQPRPRPVSPAADPGLAGPSFPAGLTLQVGEAPAQPER